MRSHRDGHGHHRGYLIDFPTSGGKFTQVDHTADKWNENGVHPLEALEDLRDLLEEVAVFFLFGCGAPLHVDAEHMREDGHAKMERYAAEEYSEHGHPLEVLEQGGPETLFAQSVSDDGKTQVTHEREDHDKRKENVPGLHVKLVQVAVKPSY